jgi:hypothetical protein
MELKLKIIQFRRIPPPSVFHLLNYRLAMASAHVLLDWIATVCARALDNYQSFFLGHRPQASNPYIYFIGQKDMIAV